MFFCSRNFSIAFQHQLYASQFLLFIWNKKQFFQLLFPFDIYMQELLYIKNILYIKTKQKINLESTET